MSLIEIRNFFYYFNMFSRRVVETDPDGFKYSGLFVKEVAKNQYLDTPLRYSLRALSIETALSDIFSYNFERAEFDGNEITFYITIADKEIITSGYFID